MRQSMHVPGHVGVIVWYEGRDRLDIGMRGALHAGARTRAACVMPHAGMRATRTA